MYYCSNCGRKDLLETDFHKNKNRSNGLQVHCKLCNKAKSHERHKKDPLKNLVRTRKWKQDNPERVSIHNRVQRGSHIRDNSRRRALKTGNVSESYSLQQIYDRDGGICQICLQPVTNKPSIDHVIPLSKGGPDTLTNVQLAHLHCNLVKGTKILT